MRPAPPCGRPCWIQTVIILAGLGALVFWALREPITPDADDCAARGQAADCWKAVYDDAGRLVP